MKPPVLLFALFTVPLFGQMVVGTIEKIEKDQIQLKGPSGSLTLHVDESTTIRKLKAFHDLSPLKAGDDIRVNYYGEDRLTAVSISAKVSISGVITEARVTHIVVSPDTSDKKATVFVYLQTSTRLGVNRTQLTVGRRVQVTGWDAGDGVIDADRITLADADVPLRTNSLVRQ